MRGPTGYFFYTTNTSRYSLRYMSQANVTPELVMEQETISAAMEEMAKPTVCVIGAGGAGSNIVSWINNLTLLPHLEHLLKTALIPLLCYVYIISGCISAAKRLTFPARNGSHFPYLSPFENVLHAQ